MTTDCFEWEVKSAPKWEEKCWGEVQHFFLSGDFACSYLRVKAGFRCSRHHHVDRHNLFLVTDGVLVIDCWQPDDKRVSTVVSAGESFSVPAGVQHQFRVAAGGGVVEVYWPRAAGVSVRLGDIVRVDTGGRVDCGDPNEWSGLSVNDTLVGFGK